MNMTNYGGSLFRYVTDVEFMEQYGEILLLF